MNDNNTNIVDLYSYVIPLLTSCCIDSNFTLECAKRIEF